VACRRISVGVWATLGCAHGSSRLQKSTGVMRPSRPANSGHPRGPSAHRVRAKTCRKLRHGGQAEVAVAAVGNVPGSLEGPRGVRWICRWKAFWAQNRVVLAHCERMGPWRFGVGSLRRACSEVRQRTSAVRPSGSCVAQKARTGPLHTIKRGSPSTGRTKRTVAGDRDAQSRRYLGSDVLATARRRRRPVRRSQRV